MDVYNKVFFNLLTYGVLSLEILESMKWLIMEWIGFGFF